MTTKAASGLSAFERLQRSLRYKSAAPTEKLDMLLERKSFTQLLADGDLFDVQGASAKTGYNAQHVRHLCRTEKIGYIRRGPTPDEVHFYFLADQLRALFTYQAAKAKP